MKQSRFMSLLESMINIAVGFGISLGAQVLFLPLLGVAISFSQNLQFAIIMTVISIARSFVLRRLFEALHIRNPISAFAWAVIAERRRQVDAEGWSTEHDDNHDHGDLARAGAAYALNSASGALESASPSCWPWEEDWWKPQGIRRDLVRAAALVLAEGEKFDRNRKGKKRTAAL